MLNGQLLDWNEYLLLFAGLFAVIAPLPAIPTFLSIVSGRTEAEKTPNRVGGLPDGPGDLARL